MKRPKPDLGPGINAEIAESMKDPEYAAAFIEASMALAWDEGWREAARYTQAGEPRGNPYRKET